MRGLVAVAALEAGLVVLGLARAGGLGPAPASLAMEIVDAPASAPRQPASAIADRLLARPLFAPGRRPPVPGPIAGPPPPPQPPRLAGLLLMDGTRRAIFAGADAAPISLAEGGQVGAFQVIAIDADRVELDGPSGHWTLRPGTDPDLRTRLAWAAPLRPLIDPDRREAETETDQ